MAKSRATEDVSAAGVVEVEVLVDNLGPKLYQTGDKTSDPDIVALLGDPRGLVREVK